MSAPPQGDGRIRVLAVAAHPVVCAGIRQIVSERSHLVLANEAHDADDAMEKVAPPPDIALLDPDSEFITLQAISRLIHAGAQRVIVFTATADVDTHQQAFELGAVGVVLKDQPVDTLVRAIEKVHAGEVWLQRRETARLLSSLMRRRDPEAIKMQSLTKREREVIARVGLGLNSATIAEQLFISEATVRNHLTSILSKLDLSNRFELAVYAFRNGLVEPNPRSTMKLGAPPGSMRPPPRRALGS